MTSATRVNDQHPIPVSPPNATNNLIRLTLAQAFAGANSVVVYTIGAIVGNLLAPNQLLATLPVSVFVVGMALCALPAGWLTRRQGRRTTFLVGTGCGVLAGLLSALAVVKGAFWLYCCATFLGGAYAAVVLSFRFAAADCVAPAKRSQALSIVMAGGILAGIIGPQLVSLTMGRWAHYPFAATFLAQAAVAAVSAVMLAGVRLPPTSLEQGDGGRPIRLIARDSGFIAAVTCGVVSYLLMNFLMTAAPLAMRFCGLPQDAANLGIQWHVIAMYAPSFFTGKWIARFGAKRIVAIGLLLTGLSATIGLTGVDVLHFWLTLILLGLGWNLAFIGASSLVLQCHQPAEKAKVQSFNDFIVFGMVAVGSLVSGGLLTSYGWQTVLWLSFIPLSLAGLALAVLSVRQRAFTV